MSQTKAQLIDPVDGTIVNADINASAAIAGSKISPDFGSQAIATTGALSCFAATISGDNQDSLNFTGTSTNANRGIAFNSKTALSHSNDSALRINNNAEFSSVNIFAVDNATSAFTLNQGSNEYITVDTNNSSELITLGNTTTNPKTAILGGSVGIGTTSPSANLHVHTDSNGEGVLIKSTGNTSNALTFDANRGAEGVIAAMYGRWNGTTVAQISFVSGSDSTNKDDGFITFGTESAASNGNVNATERVRIDSSGRLQVGSTNNTSTGTKFVVGTGNNMTSTVLINTQDTDINALTLSNWDGATTSNKVMIGFDNSGRGSFSLGMPAATNALAFFGDIDGATNERMRIDSAGTIFSFSPDDTTPNIKWRSDDANWFGSLNQSVEGATISTFLSNGGDWSANGTTYSATKALAGFETRAIAIHNQFNNGAGKVAFLQKAAGSTTTDGTVTEILKIDNDGIKFGSDTAAANGLNDYEEGTFTGGFNDFNGTYSNNTGTYTKIGNVVTIQIMISGSGGSGSGALILTSLPFASEGTPSSYRAVGVVHAHTGLVTGGVQIIGLMNNNENKVRIRTVQNNATTTDLNRNGLNSGGFEVVIGITYQTAS